MRLLFVTILGFWTALGTENAAQGDDKCAGVNCGDNGSCAADTGECVCTNNFTGDNCETAPAPAQCDNAQQMQGYTLVSECLTTRAASDAGDAADVCTTCVAGKSFADCIADTDKDGNPVTLTADAAALAAGACATKEMSTLFGKLCDATVDGQATEQKVGDDMDTCFQARVDAGEDDAATAKTTCESCVADAKPETADDCAMDDVPDQYSPDGLPVMLSAFADAVSAACATGADAQALLDLDDSGNDGQDECANVNCGANGDCVEGDCVCKNNFIGDACDTAAPNCADSDGGKQTEKDVNANVLACMTGRVNEGAADQANCESCVDDAAPSTAADCLNADGVLLTATATSAKAACADDQQAAALQAKLTPADPVAGLEECKVDAIQTTDALTKCSTDAADEAGCNTCFKPLDTDCKHGDTPTSYNADLADMKVKCIEAKKAAAGPSPPAGPAACTDAQEMAGFALTKECLTARAASDAGDAADVCTTCVADKSFADCISDTDDSGNPVKLATDAAAIATVACATKESATLYGNMCESTEDGQKTDEAFGVAMTACFAARVAAGDADASATTAAKSACETCVSDGKPETAKDCSVQDGVPAEFLDNGAPIMLTALADKASANCATGALAQELVDVLAALADSGDDDDQGDGQGAGGDCAAQGKISQKEGGCRDCTEKDKTATDKDGSPMYPQCSGGGQGAGGETPAPVVVADKCANVNCGANGDCVEGACVCKNNFTGAACDTAPAAPNPAPAAPPVTAKTQKKVKSSFTVDKELSDAEVTTAQTSVAAAVTAALGANKDKYKVEVVITKKARRRRRLLTNAITYEMVITITALVADAPDVATVTTESVKTAVTNNTAALNTALSVTMTVGAFEDVAVEAPAAAPTAPPVESSGAVRNTVSLLVATVAVLFATRL